MTVHDKTLSKESSYVVLDDSLLNVVDVKKHFFTRDGTEEKKKRLVSANTVGLSRDLQSVYQNKSRLKIDSQSVSSTNTLIKAVHKLNFKLAKVPSATKKHFIQKQPVMSNGFVLDSFRNENRESR